MNLPWSARSLANVILALVCLSSGANAAPIAAATDATSRAWLDANATALMRLEGVPGMAVAIARGGAVETVWAHGIVDTITRRPFSPDQVVHAASNGKSVYAMGVVLMARDGRVGLDTHLGSSPQQGRLGEISIRDILSHSAGLGADPLAPVQSPIFAPGSRFMYSGQGFAYLQERLTAEFGDSPDALAQIVYRDAPMPSSGFRLRDDLRPRLAPGHVPGWYFWSLSLLPWSVATALGAAALYVLSRLRKRRLQAHPFVIVGLLSLGLVFFLMRGPMGDVAALALAAGVCVMLIAIFAATSLIYALLRVFLGAHRWAWLASAGASVLFMLGAGAQVMVPFPAMRPINWPDGNVAFTFYSTAPDLAAFMAQFAAPDAQLHAVAEAIASPQVSIDATRAWGLGVGLKRLPDERVTIWQWGANIGYRSLMVADPESQIAIAIVTNSDTGGPVCQAVARGLLGASSDWTIDDLAGPIDAH